MARVKPSPRAPIGKQVKREVVYLTCAITRWDLEISAHGADGYFYEKREARATLVAHGTLDEPVKGATEVEIMLTGSDLKDAATSESIGFFLRVKPKLEGVINLAWTELEALAPFAAAGLPMYCHIGFERLRYGSGAIVSANMSTTRV